MTAYLILAYWSTIAIWWLFSREDCIQAGIGKVAYCFHKKVIGGMHVLFQLCNKLWRKKVTSVGELRGLTED